MLSSVVLAFHLVFSMGLIAVVLLQSGRSAGLGAIAGGAETFFGKKKGLDQFLSKLTAFLAGAFIVSSIVSVLLNRMG